MNDERIELDIGLRSEMREERVARGIMGAVGSRPRPRSDLSSAILTLWRPALAAAVLLVVVARLFPGDAAVRATRPSTVGAALGIPAAAERVIHRPRPATGQELLAAFTEVP
jgi:hypothetical protein